MCIYMHLLNVKQEITKLILAHILRTECINISLMQHNKMIEKMKNNKIKIHFTLADENDENLYFSYHCSSTSVSRAYLIVLDFS